MTKRLQAALDAIKGTKLRGTYVLSRSDDGGAFGDEHMHDTITRLVRAAKLTDCAWHTLRHTFCTRLAMRGVPARSIQELAGHASITTTMRYWGKPKTEDETAPEGAVVVPFLLVTPSGFERQLNANLFQRFA